MYLIYREKLNKHKIDMKCIKKIAKTKKILYVLIILRNKKEMMNYSIKSKIKNGVITKLLSNTDIN